MAVWDFGESGNSGEITSADSMVLAENTWRKLLDATILDILRSSLGRMGGSETTSYAAKSRYS